ncbi:tRNA pseudouridine(55) synthase TruB [Staphylococcus saprophyticus]|uniref:tRNA pseudouridine(55) synthase TruB n=1 Tax=Staphylococcus saprophyticus TaxID=29385 RepID=UPI0028A43B64|nr:tRNA pseudouridine(55) synthase TruB [Staphylococcus saprophyticus]MDT3924018.1 tRNA pseudouridine(55) synthase TruB [Staphylococcus saprophyticus]
MYNGILPVFKDRGLTSHDVVFKLRKILKMKKVGHTGTLDPEVSGVLPICIGSATKVSDYIMEMGKTYKATVSLGITTTTEDQTGEILEQTAVNEQDVSAKSIDDVLQQFKGELIQIPPMYSSVKVNGKKLYEYARNNQVVERPERKVNIYQINRISDLRFVDDTCQFDMIVECGKGTYIRTLATNIGKALGLPAHMSKLTRTQSGGFDINDSLTLEDIKSLHEHDTLLEKLFPIEYGLKGIEQILITDNAIKGKILNGQKFYKAEFKQNIDDIVIMVDNETHKVLAIYEPHPEKLDEIKPKKVFN